MKARRVIEKAFNERLSKEFIERTRKKHIYIDSF